MWNYDDLVIFLRVMQEGNYANTAKKMGIPASTISRRITKLESALKTKLIKRNPRKFQATKIGLTLFSQCMPLIESLERSLRAVTVSSDVIGGKLTITAPTFLVQELSEWIVDFQIAHPEVELNVYADNRMRDLFMEEVDLAIRIGPLEDSNLIAQRLWDISIMVYANQEYLDSHPAIKTPADLHGHSALFFRATSEKWVFQNKETGDVMSVRPESRLYINDIRAVVRAIQSGLGLACIPKFAIDKCVASMDRGVPVVPILQGYTVLPERSLYVVYQDGMYLSKNAKVFIEYLRQKFSELN
jgi:DNA-binding transcriptional LysR family regulator